MLLSAWRDHRITEQNAIGSVRHSVTLSQSNILIVHHVICGEIEFAIKQWLLFAFAIKNVYDSIDSSPRSHGNGKMYSQFRACWFRESATSSYEIYRTKLSKPE